MCVFVEPQLCDSSVQKHAALITCDLANTLENQSHWKFQAFLCNDYSICSLAWKEHTTETGQFESRYPKRQNNQVCNT